MKISVEVTHCDKCPHAYVSRVYTGDSWDDVRKVHCKLLNKDVHTYLDWYDKAEITTECPAKVE